MGGVTMVLMTREEEEGGGGGGGEEEAAAWAAANGRASGTALGAVDGRAVDPEPPVHGVADECTHTPVVVAAHRVEAQVAEEGTSFTSSFTL